MHQRQVLVAAVQVLDQQREHLLVRRREQHVGAPAVLEAEDVVAVLGPPPAQLVGLAGQQRREVHLLEAGGVHLLADDALDVRYTIQPSGSQVNPPGAARRM